VASTTTVKRALRALAAGHGFVSSADRGDPPACVVSEAEAAVDRLDTAAECLAADGERRLRRAVARAERQDRRDLARRGQRVLATVERFRAAAAETDSSADDEHSRPAAESRETVKRTGGQRPDR
jgi:hypothetical protein